jgi:cyclic lactone autoinducer peptide
MKKSFFNKIMVLAVALLSFFATSTAASACWWGTYQPVEPKSLREE